MQLPPVRRLFLGRAPGFYTSPTETKPCGPAHLHSWFDRLEVMPVPLKRVRSHLGLQANHFFASRRPAIDLHSSTDNRTLAKEDGREGDYPTSYWRKISPPWMKDVADQITNTIKTYVETSVDRCKDLHAVLVTRWAELSATRGALLYLGGYDDGFPQLYLSLTDLAVYGPKLDPKNLSLQDRIDFMKLLGVAHAVLYAGMMPLLRVLNSRGDERPLYDPWHDLGKSITIGALTLVGYVERTFEVAPEDRVEITYRLTPPGHFDVHQLSEPIAIKIPQQYRMQQAIIDSLHRAFVGAYLCAHFNLSKQDLTFLAVHAMRLHVRPDVVPFSIHTDTDCISRYLEKQCHIDSSDVVIAAPYISYLLAFSWLRIDNEASLLD